MRSNKSITLVLWCLAILFWNDNIFATNIHINFLQISLQSQSMHTFNVRKLRIAKPPNPFSTNIFTPLNLTWRWMRGGKNIAFFLCCLWSCSETTTSLQRVYFNSHQISVELKSMRAFNMHKRHIAINETHPTWVISMAVPFSVKLNPKCPFKLRVYKTNTRIISVTFARYRLKP